MIDRSVALGANAARRIDNGRAVLPSVIEADDERRVLAVLALRRRLWP